MPCFTRTSIGARYNIITTPRWSSDLNSKAIIEFRIKKYWCISKQTNYAATLPLVYLKSLLTWSKVLPDMSATNSVTTVSVSWKSGLSFLFFVQRCRFKALELQLSRSSKALETFLVPNIDASASIAFRALGSLLLNRFWAISSCR